MRGKRASRTELTLTGKVTLTFLVIAFCVAFLYGSNPVLFVVCCLLATFLLARGLTSAAAPPLSIHRSLPERVFLGTPFDVSLRIKNRSRWRPALALGFRDTLQIGRPGTLTCGPRIAVLPPGGEVEVSYTRSVHRRGIYSISKCVAATRFPFAFFERRLLLKSEPNRLVVLPPLGRLGRTGQRDVLEKLARPQDTRQSEGGREQFHSLREYRAGDSQRLVHWKTSARLNKLMRRVMQDESGEDLVVLLDTYVGEGLHGETRARQLERAVSCAATLLTEAAKRGRRTTVHFHGGLARHHGSMQGVLPALERLAGVTAGEESCAALVERIRGRSSKALLLSLQGPARSAVARAQTRGQSLRVWDVSHPGFERTFTRR
ncbi:MAG: DUF58 domain-containing protein [Planctomycetota bacterium]|jgi:uncharacterized protein (DUF58 family)